MISINSWYNEAVSIVNSSDSLFDKQQNLENLKYFYEKKTNTFRFSLSTKFGSFVTLFSFLTTSRAPDDYYPEAIFSRLESFTTGDTYKSMAAADDLFADTFAKFSSASKEGEYAVGTVLSFYKKTSRKQFLVQFCFLLTVLDFENQSFGLLLLKSFSTTVCSFFSSSYEIDSRSTLLKRRLVLTPRLGDDTMPGSDDNTLLIKETHFRSALASEFIDLAKFVCVEVAQRISVSLSDSVGNISVSPHYARLIFALETLAPDITLKSFADTVVTSESFKRLLGETLFFFLDCCCFFEHHAESKKDPGDTHVKTTNFVSVNDRLLHLVFSSSDMLSAMPMIVPPKPWGLKKVSNTELTVFDCGGFLTNTPLSLNSGIKLFTKNSFFNITPDTADSFNFLQSTPYCINDVYLCYVEKNFIKFLKNEVDLLDKCPSFLDSKNKIHTLSNFSDLFFDLRGGTLLLNELRTIKQLDNPSELDCKRINSLEFLIEGLRHASVAAFQDKIASFSTFLQIFFLAVLLRDFKFFSPWAACFRFRLYPDCGLLSFQGSPFAKSFLELAPASKSLEEVFLSKSNIEHPLFTFQREVDKNAFNKKRNNFSTTEKALLNLPQSYVGLDVTASCAQLFGLITGNEKVLLLTNFFLKNELNYDTKNDFYTDFLRLFKANLRGINFSKEKSLTPLFADRELNATKQKNLFDLGTSFVAFLIEKVLDRSFIKDLLMCYLYSEGDHSRKLKFLADAITTRIPYSFDSILYEVNSSLNPKLWLPKRVMLYAYLSAVNNVFIHTFKDFYPDFYEIKTLLENTLADSANVQDAGGLFLKIFPGSQTYSFFSTLKKDIQSFYYFSGFHLTKRRYNYEITTNKFDKGKVKCSTAPNIIHRLDSAILERVVLFCSRSGIPVVTAHDCFNTLPFFSDALKQAYFREAIDVGLRNDVLLNFFTANSCLSHNVLVVLDRLRTQRESLLRKLDTHELIMSDDILTP